MPLSRSGQSPNPTILGQLRKLFKKPGVRDDDGERSSQQTRSLGDTETQDTVSAMRRTSASSHTSSTSGSTFSWGRTLIDGSALIIASNLTKEEATSIRLGNLIGSGSFGRVYLGYFRGHEVAVKVISHSMEQRPRVETEVELMLASQHPNTVRAEAFVMWASPTAPGAPPLFGNPPRMLADTRSGSSPDTSVQLPWMKRRMVEKGDREEKVETWIVQEYCNAGTLGDAVLAGSGQGFFINDIPQMHVALQQLLGVARGMEYLHSCNICHGDLKAENVLLHHSSAAASRAHGSGATLHRASTSRDVMSSTSSSLCRESSTGTSAAALAVNLALQVEPKLADFGLSRSMQAGQTHQSTQTLGTISHQSPELMRRGRLAKPCDVFSFGVLMWEVIMGAAPWKGRMIGEVMSHVMLEGGRLRFRSCIPKAYAQLAEACWQEDPKARPTFTQVVQQLELLMDRSEELQQQVDKAWTTVSGFW